MCIIYIYFFSLSNHTNTYHSIRKSTRPWCSIIALPVVVSQLHSFLPTSRRFLFARFLFSRFHFSRFLFARFLSLVAFLARFFRFRFSPFLFPLTPAQCGVSLVPYLRTVVNTHFIFQPKPHGEGFSMHGYPFFRAVRGGEKEEGGKRVNSRESRSRESRESRE
jgi:hypothetical protein